MSITSPILTNKSSPGLTSLTRKSPLLEVLDSFLETYHKWRFFIYGILGPVAFGIDGCFTKENNRFPETLASILCWAMVLPLLVRAVKNSCTTSSYTTDVVGPRTTELLVIISGWLLIELFHTEVFQVYYYKIPVPVSSVAEVYQTMTGIIQGTKNEVLLRSNDKIIYRPMPLFVPAGHWIVYDTASLFAAGVLDGWKKIGSWIIDSWRRVFSSSSSSMKNSAMDRNEHPFSSVIFLVLCIPLISMGIYAGIVERTSTVEVLVLIPAIVFVYFHHLRGEGPQSSSTSPPSVWTKFLQTDLHIEIFIKLHMMWVIEIVGVCFLSSWRWQSAWPPTCQFLESDHGDLEKPLPYWFCVEEERSPGIVTLGNPPWVIGSGYLIFQVILRMVVEKIELSSFYSWSYNRAFLQNGMLRTKREPLLGGVGFEK